MPTLLAAALVEYGVAATTAAIIANGVFILGGLALSSYQQQQAKRKAKDASNAAQVDRLANVVTTIAPRELVLGRVRKGGAIYFRGSAGQDKQSFLMHLALAGHAIDGVETVYFNDQPVAIDGSGNVLTAPYFQSRLESAQVQILGGSDSVVLPDDPVPGSVSCVQVLDGEGTTSPVAFTLIGRTVTLAAAAPAFGGFVSYQVSRGTSYARVWWTLGSDGEVADARTMALFPDLWTAAHRAQGVASLVAEFTYNETAFPSGLPAVTVQMRGAPVYDPRTGLTAWSTNPALLARHVYQHPRFGKAAVSADEDARFAAAANACDVLHTYVVNDGLLAQVLSTRALYAASIVAPFGADARGLLDDLTQAMAGMWAFAGGELYIRAGVFTASVMTLTDADLAVVQRDGDSERQEQISISVHRERAQKFNIVNATIWDEQQTYKQVSLSPLRSDALVTRDGQELAQAVTLAAVSYAPQAQHVAGVMMRDARDPLTVEVSFKLRAYPLEIFDTVALTLARYGWVAKSFVILSRVWDRNQGVVKLTLKETSAAIYTPDASFLPQGYALNTALPQPFDVMPPVLSAAGVFSGTNELRYMNSVIVVTVRVTWPALSDQSVLQGGFIDVQWTPVSDVTKWQGVSVPGDATEAVLVGMATSQAILLRARSRNSVAVSDWSVQVPHTVVGKSQPPPQVTGVALSVDRVFFDEISQAAVPDLSGYQVRVLPGTVPVWSLGVPMHQGLVTDSPWLLPTRLYGIQTVMVAAVDDSGNVGLSGAATQDYGSPNTTDAIEQDDFKAAGWPEVLDIYPLPVGSYPQYSVGNVRTFARASVATYFDVNGVLQTAAANVPRFTYDPVTHALQGLLIEAASTNYVTNSSLLGAVAGVIGAGGAWPTGWSLSGPPAGLTYEILSLSTLNGIPTMTFRVSGTPSTNAGVRLQMLGASTAAATNDIWTGTLYVAKIAGSLANSAGQFLSDYATLAGAYLGTLACIPNLVVAGPTLTRLGGPARMTVANAGKLVNLYFYLATTAAAPIDVTFQIGGPQLEKQSAATSYIPTTNAAVTRPAEVAGIGTITSSYNWSIDGSGNIAALADPAADFWTIAADFWVRDGVADFWGGSAYLPMQYIARFDPIYGGGEILLELAASGSRITLDYRIDGATLGDFWAGDGGAGSADFWSGSALWGTSGAWQTWLGSALSVRHRGVEWRIGIDAGPQQGLITGLVASLVLPLVSQVFAQRPIAAAGTRLAPADGSPARNWVAVTAVSPTPVKDGGGATSGRILDFDATNGPLIELLNDTGAAVDGSASATVFGFEDATA